MYEAERLLELADEIRQAQDALYKAFDEYDYEDFRTGVFGGAKYYKIHPDYFEEAKKHSSDGGIDKAWLDSIPSGMVFEV